MGDLEHPAHDTIQEETIVRDNDDRAGVLGQRLLEPRHGLNVKVVGRLIEQQEVGVLEQDLAQCHAAALTTRAL